MSKVTNTAIRIIVAICLLIQFVSKEIELFYIISLFIFRNPYPYFSSLPQILGMVEIEAGFPDVADKNYGNDVLLFSGYTLALYCIAIIFGGFFLLYTNKLFHQKIVSLLCFQAHCKILTT